MKRSSYRKIKETSRLLEISKKLKTEDMLFLYNNLNAHSRTLISELVYNVLYNTKVLNLSEKTVKKLRKVIYPHKTEFEAIALKTKPELKKNKIMKKQIGGGVFTSLALSLAPVILGLLANKVK